MRRTPPREAHRRGFTLIELLVVIGIIAVLMALLMSAVQRVRESASRLECANNLRQINLAVHQFHDTQRGLPPARTNWQPDGTTWAVFLLPYIEQRPAYDLFDGTTPRLRYDQAPAQAREHLVPLYFCPSRRGPMPSEGPWDNGESIPAGRGSCGDYAACNGDNFDHPGPGNGAFPSFSGGTVYRQPNLNLVRSFPDGLSNTLFIGEKHVPPDDWGRGYGDSSIYNSANPWTMSRPAGPGYPLARDAQEGTLPARFGSYHPGICQFALGDGSVRVIGANISEDTLGRLANRRDGRPVTDLD